MRFVYPVDLDAMTEEDGGGYLVRLPDWDEAVTQGDDEADALWMAADCLETVAAYRISKRLPLPSPSPLNGRPSVTLSGQLAMKAALWVALNEGNVSLNELARRLGQASTQPVLRLLNPKHAARPEAYDTALKALGKRVVVELVDA